MTETPVQLAAEVHHEPTAEVIREPVTEPAVPEQPAISAYLLQRFPKAEAQARLGNGVRAATKYALEDYVKRLKRQGWPASEAHVMEGMFILVERSPEFRDVLTRFLTGAGDSTS